MDTFRSIVVRTEDHHFSVDEMLQNHVDDLELLVLLLANEIKLFDVAQPLLVRSLLDDDGIGNQFVGKIHDLLGQRGRVGENLAIFHARQTVDEIQEKVAVVLAYDERVDLVDDEYFQLSEIDGRSKRIEHVDVDDDQRRAGQCCRRQRRCRVRYANVWKVDGHLLDAGAHGQGELDRWNDNEGLPLPRGRLYPSEHVDHVGHLQETNIIGSGNDRSAESYRFSGARFRLNDDVPLQLIGQRVRQDQCLYI